MLIVNADDLGGVKAATDAALFCYAQKRITSTSAMVFMEDSARAAEQAIDSGIDVGLHINLVEAFSGSSVPARLREDHEGVRRFLSTSKYAVLVYHPLLTRQFRYVFEMQYAEFLRLYGKPPSHIDGHIHMHLCSNMLFQRILPAGTKVRRTFSWQAGEVSLPNRMYRRLVDYSLRRRHRLTDYFFALTAQRAPNRLARIIDLAQDANVELMTHPHYPADYEFLMSDTFGEALSRVRLAGYDAL